MKNKLLLKSLMVAGLLAVVCGFPMQASALPLETFSFHQHSGFLVDETLAGTKANSIGWYDSALTPGSVGGTFDTIAWGLTYTGFPYTTGNGGYKGSALDPSPSPLGNPATGDMGTEFSGLQVIGHEGSLITGGDLGGGTSDWGAWAAISTIYHQNRAITNLSSNLLSAVVYSDLIFDHDPNGDFFTSANPIPVGFQETFNTGSCPDGNPNGSVCDDLFTFPAVGFANVFFGYGGHQYEVQFGLDNFVDSSTDFLTGGVGGVVSVWTAENVTSSMDVTARIREVVPEPATLVLLGLGLLGLGLAKRRERIMKG